ncbi:Protein-export membrane protein SecG [Methylophilaceae bacterium]|nr:Protein-export membrane protein SecG [Methylophilaceae bacterium]
MVVHVLAAAGVIGLVLLQHGKGADMGAAFGSGASGSLFGVSGSSNFMSRTTAICVVLFFATSLSLAYISGHRDQGSSVIKVQTNSVTTPDQDNAATGDAAPSEANTAKDVPQ